MPKKIERPKKLKQLRECAENVLKGALKKRRKFVETVELQVILKGYNPHKDKRFSGCITVPHLPKLHHTAHVYATEQMADEAAAIGVPYSLVPELQKLNRNKKLVKKLHKQADNFLTCESIIRLIPRILGPGLSKAGKFPSLCTAGQLASTVDKLKHQVTFQLKKATHLNVPVGHVLLTTDQLVENLTIAINYLVSLLKKNWGNIKSIYIKSTMGRPCRVL